jgi:hypothetical protein
VDQRTDQSLSLDPRQLQLDFQRVDSPTNSITPTSMEVIKLEPLSTMISRDRQIKLMPVCAPAETVEELKFQIDILMDSYECKLLKMQLEEAKNGK